ncbi:MAG: TetR family transcriptional regulator C-terminal domain-containing protein [Gelidibacter sp.]
MAKKKNLSDKDLITFYMDYVLENGEQPKTIYAFAKANNFDESKFYDHFGSFEALEKSIFNVFFEHTIVSLEKSEDYAHFEARNRLLAFYFTFFENLTANRSFVLYQLNAHKNRLKSLRILSGLRERFQDYIAQLNIETLDIKNEQLNKIQERALEESAWFQLLLTLKFWMDDSSPSFEKTDIFIEKSVNASFDIINIAPLKSVIDLGKFLYKEKMTMNNS